MRINRLYILSLLFLASCDYDEETKRSLEVSKDIYETYKKLNESTKGSTIILDSMLKNLEKYDKPSFESITPITDAKKKVGEENVNVNVEILEYEE